MEKLGNVQREFVADFLEIAANALEAVVGRRAGRKLAPLHRPNHSHPVAEEEF